MNILINSFDRQSGTSSNFTIQLPTNILLSTGRKLRMYYLQMYNTIYNINTNNNYIDFVVSATTYSATITPGIYNASTLAAALQTAMTNQVSNTWSVTYNSTALAMTISGASNFQLLFSSGTHASNSLWQVLGFANTNGLAGIDTTSATSTTSTQSVNLTYPQNIYLTLNNISSGQFLSSDSAGFTYIIPINVTPGDLIQYTDNEYFPQIFDIPSNVNSLQKITVQLTTYKNVPINLNNSEWSFVLKLVE